SAAPVFTSSQVSQYLYGSASTQPGSKPIRQLRFNVPNLPLFVQGTTPFIGDYIDVAAVPFSPLPGGGWTFNTADSNPQNFHAVWTDNRDVRPPLDGNWTLYTPPGPGCVSAHAGMRNQNIYTARITEGLLVSSPGNSKLLNSTVQSTFALSVQNSTPQ